jgi:hypothetical protein
MTTSRAVPQPKMQVPLVAAWATSGWQSSRRLQSTTPAAKPAVREARPEIQISTTHSAARMAKL